MIRSDMICEIMKCTYKYIQNIKIDFSEEKECRDWSKSEFMALLRFIYFLGSVKQNHRNVRQLWSVDEIGIRLTGGNEACFVAYA